MRPSSAITMRSLRGPAQPQQTQLTSSIALAPLQQPPAAPTRRSTLLYSAVTTNINNVTQSRAYTATRPLRALEKISTAGNAFHQMTVKTSSFGGSGGGGDGDDQQQGMIKGESGISLMRCLKPAHAEAFYFEEGQSFCRLCLEETTLAPRVHIAASSRQSHTNHTCREVVLDSLTLWNRRGYTVDNIVQCWSHALYHHNEFPRIPSLTDWRWSVAKRARRVHELLAALRDMGYIDLSLAIATADTADQGLQQRKRLAFERLECIGDNSWGPNMSNRMMLMFPDRQWIHSQSAYSFNCFRDALEMNLNLEVMYELFDLGGLLPPSIREKVGTGKVKADVLESLLGELQIWMWGFEPELHDTAPYIEVNGEGEATVFGILQHVLTEFYDVLILAYCQELSGTAIPLSKELATRHVWAGHIPPLYRTKDRSGAAKRRTSYGNRKVSLPALDVLPQTPSSPIPPPATGKPQPLVVPGTPVTLAAAANTPPPKLCAAHTSPLKRTIVPETIDRFTHRDVFEPLMASMKATERGDITHPSPTTQADYSRAWKQCVGTLKLPIATDAADDDDISHLVAADEDDVYFRDKQYDLTQTPETINDDNKHKAMLSARTSTVDSTGDVDNMLFAFPFLATEREGLQQLQGLVIGGTVCLFEPSSLVPPEVKPPNAGVITDKNLFLGVFLNAKIDTQGAAAAAEEYFL